MPGRATQTVTVNYTTSLGGSGSVMIDTGQAATEISVPTDDDDLDEANQTVTVTLTGVTGGAQINSLGRTASGVVRDNDPGPAGGVWAVS